jgi:hypothetical protein
MPRYYLHVRRGREFVLDRDGIQFPDQVTVELEAMRAAAKAWRAMKVTADPSRYALEITDAAGESVLTIPFSDALKAEPAL